MSNDAQVKYIVYTICYLIISLCLMFNILIKMVCYSLLRICLLALNTARLQLFCKLHAQLGGFSENAAI